MSKAGVRVRGIYTTAITRLLLDSGIPIADPTEVIKERFKDELTSDSIPAVTVKDREDREALVIVGMPSVATRVINTIKTAIKNWVLRVVPYKLYSTYKVKIGRRCDEGYLVNLPEGTGKLITTKPFKEGDEVLAHIARADSNPPILKPGGVIVGLYARAFQGSKHGFSHFIRDLEKKASLLSLASSVGLEGWGLRFRSSANKAELTDILEEVSKLKSRISEIMSKAKEVRAPHLLSEGETLAFFLVNFDAKIELDNVRSRQLPTINYHHFYKSCGGRVSDCIEIFEKILPPEKSQDILHIYLEDLLNELDGKQLELRHEKVTGEEYRYRCKVSVERSNLLKLERSIKGEGTYDGLGEKRAPGDMVESYTSPFSRIIIHNYYSKNGEFKGIYANINSPLELSPRKTGWYLDLEVDVVMRPGEKAKVIDEDKIKTLRRRNILSEETTSLALKVANNTKTLLDEGIDPREIVLKMS